MDKLQACKIALGVVAVNSNSLTEIIAVGNDRLAILAQAVGNHTGGVDLTAGPVDSSHIDRLIHILGSDAFHSSIPAVSVGNHLHHTGGIGGGESVNAIVGFGIPVAEGNTVVRGQAGDKVIVDGECTLKGHRGICIIEGSRVHDEVTGSVVVCLDQSIDHGSIVIRHKRLASRTEEGIHQLISLVVEVDLRGSTIVQHGYHQSFCTTGGAGAAQNALCIGNCMVTGNVTVGESTVRQLCIYLEVQCIAQILGGNAIGMHQIGVAAAGKAGNHILCILNSTIGQLGVKGDQAHLLHVAGIGNGVIDVVLNLVLKGNGGIIQSQRGRNDDFLLFDNIAQIQRAVIILNQSKGDLHTAGNIQLIGNEVLVGGIIQCRLGSIEAQPAVGHVPTLVIGGLNRNVAVGFESSHQLAVHEQIFATVVVILLTGVVTAVDVAEEVILKMLGTAHGANAIHEIMQTSAATLLAEAVRELVAHEVTAV